MRSVLLYFFIFVLTLSGCSKTHEKLKMPNGYKIWVMNSEEVYVSDAANELLVGPSLKKLAVVDRYILTFGEQASSNYVGNLRTHGYSIIERKTGKVTTGMTQDAARIFLKKRGQKMPRLISYDEFDLVTQ